MKKILVIVTNTSKYDTIERPTGLWLGEAVHFVDVMEKAGFAIDYASPQGGYTPIDPHSLTQDMMTELDWKYYQDHSFMNKLGNTLAIKDVNPSDYAAIYYTGGHGVVWDFPNDVKLQEVASKIYANGGVISSVCHGVAGLLNIKDADGNILIAGKKITGFSNSEEQAVQLDKFVPFSTEDEVVNRKANYVKGDDWGVFAVTDNRFVTGQNPASGAAVATQLIELLK
ncbi:type 1 glutamine amidotransferase domain-containing protein [uncultured Clostridium sp.]|uniref:type 1 glutamine amidotransferase domain-containing protein n=1 Tax=uncultured Clostridium sp. TaxID=59620 RepID=UPI002620FFFD|nr:type 1 glutamine amidotransferase domain-containing protein [uncultured Clostridium sp.]